MVRAGLSGKHDDQGSGSMDALDPAELDVARGARAADERARAHGIQQRQALRDAVHDIRHVHDAHMDVGHERDDASPAGGSGVEHDGAGPVSYTHLRAHETDSYLVCRLLLEKKKI